MRPSLLAAILILFTVAVSCTSDGDDGAATPTETTSVASSPAAETANNSEFTFVFPEGVGGEKAFPDALLDSSNPLSHDRAAEVWSDFISNSIVIDELNGHPFIANAYCASGAVETHYSAIDPFLVGIQFNWKVLPAPESDWSSSNLSLIGQNVVLPLPIPVNGAMPSWVAPVFGTDITRVYDYPSCDAAFGSLKAAPSKIFELLGVGEQRPFPSQNGPNLEPLSDDEIVQNWTNYMANTLTWNNVTGRPESMHCADGTLMALGRFFPEEIWGEVFQWRIVAGHLPGEQERLGSDLLNAGILQQDFGPVAPIGIYGVQNTDPTNGFRTVHPDVPTPLFEVDFPTCSVEVGREILQRFAAD